MASIHSCHSTSPPTEERRRTMKFYTLAAFLLGVGHSEAFLTTTKSVGGSNIRLFASTIDETRTSPKEALLGLLGRKSSADTARDPVLADPITKEALTVEVPGTLLGGVSSQRIKYNLKSSNNTYSGSSDTFLNLLVTEDDSEKDKSSSQPLLNQAVKSFAPFIPPPLRSALATAGAPMGTSYVPMRDLFTSPAVSFAYERGWRQGFASSRLPWARYRISNGKGLLCSCRGCFEFECCGRHELCHRSLHSKVCRGR